MQAHPCRRMTPLVYIDNGSMLRGQQVTYANRRTRGDGDMRNNRLREMGWRLEAHRSGRR